jgi:hypothetical protein
MLIVEHKTELSTVKLPHQKEYRTFEKAVTAAKDDILCIKRTSANMFVPYEESKIKPSI